MSGNLIYHPRVTHLAMRRLLCVSLLLGLVLSGCLQREGGIDAPLDDSNPDRAVWEWFGNGTGSWRLQFGEHAAGAACDTVFVLQGTSTRFEFVGLFAMQGLDPDPPVRYLSSDTDQAGLPRAQVRAGPVDAESTPIVHRDEWLWAPRETVILSSATTLYAAFVNTTKTSKELPAFVALEALEAGAWLQVRCDRPIPQPALSTSMDFAIYDERLFAGGVAMHLGDESGFRFAHVATQDQARFASPGDLVLMGLMSGDPSKAGTLRLDHPEGSREWLFLPVPFGLAGDALLSHEGPPGEYTLTLNTINGGPLIALRVALLSFSVEENG